MTETKLSENGVGNREIGQFNCAKKQQPVAVKKAALRDLQNDNRIMVVKAMEDSDTSVLKKRLPFFDSITKRASIVAHVALGPANYNSPNGSHLVYARRKPEPPESVKCSTSDGEGYNAAAPETIPEKILRKEPNISLSKKPSLPLSGYYSSITSLDNHLKGFNSQHLGERCKQMHILFPELESNQDAYIQALRSFTSVELSRHAFELEKRAIQLSLEEGKEMQRVKVLNVLGKASKG